jgi:hypothetical protein
MYHQFDIQQFYVILTQSIYVLCMDLRESAFKSLYDINWVVFII